MSQFDRLGLRVAFDARNPKPRNAHVGLFGPTCGQTQRAVCYSMLREFAKKLAQREVGRTLPKLGPAQGWDARCAWRALLNAYLQAPRPRQVGPVPGGWSLRGMLQIVDPPTILVPHAAWTMQRFTLLIERVLPLAILLVAVIGAPVMIFSPDGLPRLRGLERELAQVEDETAELGREIDALRGRVLRLRDDPTAVERIARDNLGMLRQTEVVFQFPASR